MASRPAAVARARRAGVPSLDLVLLTPLGDRLGVLVTRAGRQATLPTGEAVVDGVDGAARRLARATIGVDPAWLAQAGVHDAVRRHLTDAPWSVAYVGVVPAGTPAPDDAAWVAVDAVPPLVPRQRAILDGAMATVRLHLDSVPVAFRLLPATFTLSELQQVYELLLGRTLHKASFRRALQAAYLVEPTDAWRSEGRGRPAQLFRYAPRRRRPGARAVRFDLLG